MLPLQVHTRFGVVWVCVMQTAHFFTASALRGSTQRILSAEAHMATSAANSFVIMLT